MKKNIFKSLAAVAAAICMTFTVPTVSYAAAPAVTTSSNTYTVSVKTGYLALRTAPAYDSRNEIGELYTGDTVTVTDYSGSQYWYVYSPKHDKYGYVNKDYLLDSNNQYSVSVRTGYLALRTAPAYDERNEIGELYTGDTVTVTDYSGSQYWYVYSPKHGKSGYVNKDYLVKTSGSTTTSNTKVVRVAKGYLALRTAPAYDSRNEIGELYTGDTVTVTDYSGSQYWYVYSPKHGKSGYVNKDYLFDTTSSTVWKTVSVKTGYLALRNAKAYDERNEIGEMYTGEQVQVIDSTTGTYWYVYSPKLNKYGYCNSDYLR